jgi:hypothetical protein
MGFAKSSGIHVKGTSAVAAVGLNYQFKDAVQENSVTRIHSFYNYGRIG